MKNKIVTHFYVREEKKDKKGEVPIMVWIPSGWAINPITKTNWEGVGVEPHIKTTKEAALDKARIMALEKLKKQSKE